MDSPPVCAQERHPEPDVCAGQEGNRRVCRETRFGRQNWIVWFRPRHSADSINPHADDDGSGVAVEAWSEKERDVPNAGRFRAGTGVRAACADADGESIGCGPGTGKSG